jgi:hypothetical protein
MHPRNSFQCRATKIASVCLAVLLIAQAVPIAAAQQETSPQQPAQHPPAQQPVLPQNSSQHPAGNQQTPPPALPPIDTPGTGQRPAQDASLSPNELPSAPDPQAPTQSQQEGPQQPPALPQQPVGTAAAPAEKPTGVPGSRPSGAAIAPAKQKRVRAFVISIGIALAGAAAVGTVVGLSKASHSTP